MPSYQYTCSKCSTFVDKLRGIADEEPTYYCDSCGSILKRSYAGSSPSVTFNGSGFYSTDKVK